jgi:hypothetical protein
MVTLNDSEEASACLFNQRDAPQAKKMEIAADEVQAGSEVFYDAS